MNGGFLGGESSSRDVCYRGRFLKEQVGRICLVVARGWGERWAG